MGVLGSALIALSTAAQGSGSMSPSFSPSMSPRDCERGILDGGVDGMNVLVYELCPGRLTVGFESSDMIEEMSCRPDGDIRLWLVTDDDRCEAQPASDHDQVYELWEPLAGVGRATAAPVRKLLTCRGGRMNRATIVVPEARDALLETRTGDTKYDQVTRQFVSRCLRPDA
jgi:hypothetical protein